MFKKYVTSQQALNKIEVSKRSAYYLDDNLVNELRSFSSAAEPLVDVETLNVPFLVRPFWQDNKLVVEDKELQELLDVEGEEFRKHIASNPDFKLKLREVVIDKLIEAQESLPKNLKLVVKAGFRPIKVQYNLFQQLLKYFKNKYPNLTDEQIYKMNLEYVADPDNFIPPHSTGGAVDLLIFDIEKYQEVDMGSPINYPDERSWTYNFESINHEQIKNRLMLNNLMIKCEFANLASEWWHYSYGDQYWATFYGKTPLYNSIQSI